MFLYFFNRALRVEKIMRIKNDYGSLRVNLRREESMRIHIYGETIRNRTVQQCLAPLNVEKHSSGEADDVFCLTFAKRVESETSPRRSQIEFPARESWVQREGLENATKRRQNRFCKPGKPSAEEKNPRRFKLRLKMRKKMM